MFILYYYYFFNVALFVETWHGKKKLLKIGEILGKDDKLIVILEKMCSMCVSWGTLYFSSLQWSEKEWDYFYPTPKAGAAVSKVNNYGDSMLRRSGPKRTQTHSRFCIHTHTDILRLEL